MHLIIEADDNESMSRGMQGLSIRIARALNKQWIVGFADRCSSAHPDNEIEIAVATSFLLKQIYRAIGKPWQSRNLR